MKSTRKTAMGIPIVFITLFVLATPAWAWHTKQVAEAICVADQAVINGSLTNKDNRAMDVTMVTAYGEDGPRTVEPGNSEEFSVETGHVIVPSGSVSFELTWTDGGKGIDDKKEEYTGVDCTPVVPPVEHTADLTASRLACPDEDETSVTYLVTTDSAATQGELVIIDEYGVANYVLDIVDGQASYTATGITLDTYEFTWEFSEFTETNSRVIGSGSYTVPPAEGCEVLPPPVVIERPPAPPAPPVLAPPTYNG